MQRSTVFILFLAFTSLLFITGCKPKADTVQVGLTAVLTGSDAQFGTKMVNGSRIAIDEWNAKGGVLGKKIEAVVRDDEGKPNQAVAVAQELVAQGVVGVIGHFNSSCTIPSSPIYAQNNIIQITPASTNTMVTQQGFTTLFRLCGRDDQQGGVLATFAFEKLHVRKVAVLHNKTPYGQGIAEEFQKKFESLGGKIVFFNGVASEEQDFRATITTIKNSGADALFWGGVYSQGGPVFTQMRQAGLEIPMLGGDGIFEQKLIDTIGQNVKGLYVSFSPDYRKLPGTHEFLEKYRAQYGEEGPYSIYGYVATHLLLQAIADCGSTDSTKVAAMLRSKEWETSLGGISFDAKGDLTKANYVIWTVKDGKFVELE